MSISASSSSYFSSEPSRLDSQLSAGSGAGWLRDRESFIRLRIISEHPLFKHNKVTSVAAHASFEDVLTQITECTGLPLDSFCIQWQDEDGDRFDLGSEEEWAIARAFPTSVAAPVHFDLILQTGPITLPGVIAVPDPIAKVSVPGGPMRMDSGGGSRGATQPASPPDRSRSGSGASSTLSPSPSQDFSLRTKSSTGEGISSIPSSSSNEALPPRAPSSATQPKPPLPWLPSSQSVASLHTLRVQSKRLLASNPLDRVACLQRMPPELACIAPDRQVDAAKPYVQPVHSQLQRQVEAHRQGIPRDVAKCAELPRTRMDTPRILVHSPTAAELPRTRMDTPRILVHSPTAPHPCDLLNGPALDAGEAEPILEVCRTTSDAIASPTLRHCPGAAPLHASAPRPAAPASPPRQCFGPSRRGPSPAEAHPRATEKGRGVSFSPCPSPTPPNLPRQPASHNPSAPLVSQQPNGFPPLRKHHRAHRPACNASTLDRTSKLGRPVALAACHAHHNTGHASHWDGSVAFTIIISFLSCAFLLAVV
eukprot:EG_transcript_9332